MADLSLDTARLRLAPWRAEDSEPLRAVLDTPAVTRWLGGMAGPERWAAFAYQFARGGAFPTFVLRLQAVAEPIGIIGLNRVRAAAGPRLEGQTEIFWRLAEHAWGRGLAREAAEAALNYGFAAPERATIVAFTVPQNHASWGLMQRLGFTRWRDADFDHPEVADPAIVRHIVYRIDRGDWQA